MHTPEWSVIHPKGFDAVYWTFAEYPYLICNGLKIYNPNNEFEIFSPIEDVSFNWPEYEQWNKPKIAVFDSSANLSLTAQRYALSNANLPFITELYRDITLSFIAHALVCGPNSRIETHILGDRSYLHPLNYEVESKRKGAHNILHRWCSSSHAVIPTDPWLYSLLQTDTYLLFGPVVFGGIDLGTSPIGNFKAVFAAFQAHEHQAILCSNGLFQIGQEVLGLLDILTKNSLQVLRKDVIDVQILLSIQRNPESRSYEEQILQEINNQKYNWHKISRLNSQQQYFLFQTGTSTTSLPLDCLIETIETMELENLEDFEDFFYLDFFYVAKIKIKPDTPQPETLLAKIWNECLGPQPIPFNLEARSKLIEHGKQHPELKRHIEAWEEMKRTGSKWVVGDAEE